MPNFRPLSETKFINDPSLVSYWKFDEASGNAADSKGSNTLVNQNGVTYTAAKFRSGALIAAASSQKLSIPDASQSGLDFSKEFTFSWLQNKADNAISEPIVKTNAVGNQRSYIIQHWSDQKLYISVSSDGTAANNPYWVSTNPISSANGYNHWMVSFNSGVIVVTFNGAIVAGSWVGTPSTVVYNSTSEFAIGYSAGNNYSNIAIDDLACFSRALSASEGNEIYQGMTLGEYLGNTVSPVLLQDDFTGTTIDTSKWTETDPNGIISQNGVLNISNPHTGTLNIFVNKLESVSSIASGVSVVQANFTWTTDTTQQPMPSLILYKDANNFARIASRDNVVGNTYRLLVTIGGSTVYNLDDGTTTSKGKDVKIVADATTIKFYYWSGSAWVQMGATVTASLGYSRKFVISTQDLSSFTGGNPGVFDNAYFTNKDYTTQYPEYSLGSTKLLMHLNGNSIDSSGNNNHGVDTAITYVDGKFGKCASFNGSSSKIATQVIPLTNSNFTVVGWVNINNATNNHVLLAQGNSGSNSPIISLAFRTNVNDIEIVNRGDSEVGLLAYVSYQIPVSTWFNVIWTCSKTQSKLYINGYLINTTNFTENTGTFNTQNLGVRQRVGYDSYFNGKMEEVDVESRIWSAEEAAKYYANARGLYATL